MYVGFKAGAFLRQYTKSHSLDIGVRQPSLCRERLRHRIPELRDRLRRRAVDAHLPQVAFGREQNLIAVNRRISIIAAVGLRPPRSQVQHET